MQDDAGICALASESNGDVTIVQRKLMPCPAPPGPRRCCSATSLPAVAPAQHLGPWRRGPGHEQLTLRTHVVGSDGVQLDGPAAGDGHEAHGADRPAG